MLSKSQIVNMRIEKSMFKHKIKTAFAVVFISMIFCYPLLAKSLTLWEFYTDGGEKLPSITERSVIYQELSPGDVYIGSMSQNIALLQYLQGGEVFTEKTAIEDQDIGEFFGGVTGSSELPQITANFESSLVSRIEKTDITMELVDSTDEDGNTLSGWYGFIVDINSTSKRETIIANCSGSSCSELLRGVSYSDGVSTSSERAQVHGRGADVSLTNHPNLTIITNILNGVDGVPDVLYYDDSVAITGSSSSNVIIHKEYADNLAIAGSPDASASVKGIVEIADGIDVRDGNYKGSTGAVLVLPSLDVRHSFTGDDYEIISTNVLGYVDQSFIDLEEDFTFSGDFETTGETTLATTTISYTPSSDTDVVDKQYADEFDTYRLLGVGTTTQIITDNTTNTYASAIIPANSLNSNNVVRIRIYYKGTNTSNADTDNYFNLNYGSSTVIAFTDTDNPTGDGIGILEAYLSSDGDTSTQKGMMTLSTDSSNKISFMATLFSNFSQIISNNKITICSN